MQQTLATFTTGKEATKALQAWLTDQSAWFECTPLPSDNYEIAVKEEQRVRVRTYINEQNLNAFEGTR